MGGGLSMTKRDPYYRTFYIGNVIQVADDEGHVINPLQDDAPDARWMTASVVVGAVAISLEHAGVPFTGRQSITICNLGASTIYIGPTNAVTAAAGANAGFPILSNQIASFPLGSSLRVWGISTVAGNDVRITEIFS